MNKIPMELWVLIASNLNSEDLGIFRLIQKKFAAAGSSLVTRNGISVLNTFDCLNGLNKFLDSTIANSTKELTLLHGKWPVCNRAEWEVHPLLLGGKDRPKIAYVQDAYATKADEAFQDYLEFIGKEENRRYGDDVEILLRAMKVLGKLHTVNISHIQTWHPSNLKYRDLQKKIWMTPCRQNMVSSVVEAFLLGFGGDFSNVRTLRINSTFNAADVNITPEARFPSIQNLHVGSFQVMKSQEAIHRFLYAFPNLLHLSMGFQGWGPSIPDVIGCLFWARLEVLHMHDIWASEQEILAIFRNHLCTLKEFALSHGALTQGSWRSLFTQMRSLNTSVLVTADGELYGRRSKDTLILHHHAAARLVEFMQDQNVNWPFVR